MTPDAVSALANLATAGTAVTAAWFAVREYMRSGRWKAAELAATHLEKLTTDETLQFACQALDWGTGPIVVPTAFRAMAGTDRIEHDAQALEIAMEPVLNAVTLANARGLLYRHCFDRLFGYLDSAQELLDLGLVRPVHLAGLRYWLRLIASWTYAGGPKNEVFIPFIVAYGYGRVLRLFDSLGVPVGIPPTFAEDAQRIKTESAPNG